MEPTEKKKAAESFVSIADLINMCLSRWRWFVASVALCLLVAVRYLMVTPFQYTRYAAIMVREEILGDNATDKNGKDFNQIGFVNQKSNVPDVVRHITSLDVLMDVVSRVKPELEGDDRLDEAMDIQSRFSAETQGFESCIIDLTYRDYSTAAATQMLETIIQVYNDKWVQEKMLSTQSTSHFIDTRLRLLEQELNIVDDSISTFKSRYGITDLARVSEVYLQQQSKADADILTLENQKSMAEYIRSLLDDDTAPDQLLLVNSGINNSLIESQISLYNSMLLQMQSHLEYTSTQNPLIINIEKELQSLRKNILANVNNHIRTIDIQLKSLQEYHGEASSKISSNPDQAKYLLSIDREQKVKESLYMFLLQKKEENEISLSYRTAPTKVIDPPNGSGKPTKPNRVVVLFAAMLLGFMTPLTVIFLRASLDDTVRDHYDIERNSDVPFLGEVPYSGREHSLESLLMPFGFGSKAKASGIVVGHDMLDASNEAFRILRHNMEAIAANKAIDSDGRVYLVKSTQIEVGKTFVAMNLALVKAIGGKRVLFIDGDLRQASASRLWRTPLLGLTDYLHGEESDYRRLLFHPEACPMLDVLPAGALPTNPTELLRSPRLAELFATLRQHYDSIIIDSPSAGMLADADIIEHIADCTLFIIRAGRFNRHRLDEINAVHSRDNNKPQYVILNGVSINSRYGYAYLHKYERSEAEKNTVTISRWTILFNKVIFKKRKNHNTTYHV